MLSKKPWLPELVLLFCGAQFLCVVLGQIGVLFLHKFGVGGFKHENDFGNILLATLSFQGATWILIPIFLRLQQWHWRDAFGFRKMEFLPSLTLAAAAFIPVLFVALLLQSLSVLAMQKLHWQPGQETAVKLLLTARWWPTGVYLAFFAVVLAPVAEEFIFRGVLFPFLKELGHPKAAWLGVSALFALIHGDAAVFVPLFVLALALTWLYEKTGNLLAPIAVHGLFNAVNLVVFVFAQKYGAL